MLPSLVRRSVAPATIGAPDSASTNQRQYSTYMAAKPASSGLKIVLSCAVTLVIIAGQLLLAHYLIFSIGFKSSHSSTRSSLLARDWDCLFPGFSEVYELSQRFDVDLVIVDPDLLESLEPYGRPSGHYAASGGKFSSQNLALEFSTSSTKRNQESKHKTIVHLAAINETSGGQPSLKLFFNALKSNGYVVLKYDDISGSMQPEVYRRVPQLFDDMPPEAVIDHKHSAAAGPFEDDHNYDSNKSYEDPGNDRDRHREGDKINKLYTEFIAHLFVVNNTSPSDAYQRGQTRCAAQNGANIAPPFTVIHVAVLYNFNLGKDTQMWIQPGLDLDELDRHKLLSHNVHSFDFRIPIEQSYLHPKREIVTVVKPVSRLRDRFKKIMNKIRVFEPIDDRTLSYVNNSYVHCKSKPFRIGLLLDNPRRYSNYLTILDGSQRMANSELRKFMDQQLTTAFKFMTTFSRAYDNFTYWLTGSSLLAYHKHCDLIVVPDISQLNNKENDDELFNSDNMVVNLELGLFDVEFNDSILDDLAMANVAGVTMMSDWRRTDAVISFHLRDCPNFVFDLYIYKLYKDQDGHHFKTRNSMIFSHKFTKRTNSNVAIQVSKSHRFKFNNMIMCWTRLEGIEDSFRVPCDVHGHLSRIYI